MNRKIPKLKKVILQEPVTSYLEKYVRFSFAKCEIGKKYCMTYVDKQELERLFKTLGKFEKMTWRQLMELRGKNGIKRELNGDTNNKLKAIDNTLNYGHMRVNGTSKVFRIFVGTGRDDLIYIIWLDREGKEHHK